MCPYIHVSLHTSVPTCIGCRKCPYILHPTPYTLQHKRYGRAGTRSWRRRHGGSGTPRRPHPGKRAGHSSNFAVHLLRRVGHRLKRVVHPHKRVGHACKRVGHTRRACINGMGGRVPEVGGSGTARAACFCTLHPTSVPTCVPTSCVPIYMCPYMHRVEEVSLHPTPYTLQVSLNVSLYT